jgi:hypothetical protein
MVTVVRYRPEFREAWDSFVPVCRNSSFLFLRSYMDYHKERFSDMSLMIYRKDRLSALFPACIKNGETVSSHEGLSYGGMLIMPEEHSDNTMTYLAEVLRFYHEYGYGKLIVRQIPAFYSKLPSDEIEYALFLAQSKVMQTSLHSAIDLNQNGRLPMQRRRKKGVMTAEENGIEVVETSDFEDFWKSILMPNLMDRHEARPVHCAKEIQSLSESNAGHIRQFNALYKGRIMAGCTVFDVGDVVKAQYFSGCDEGRANGSLDYLVYILLSRYFGDRRYFDFGNSNTVNGMKINHGLLSWKEGFGARSYIQRYFEVETGKYRNILDAIC